MKKMKMNNEWDKIKSILAINSPGIQYTIIYIFTVDHEL